MVAIRDRSRVNQSRFISWWRIRFQVLAFGVLHPVRLYRLREFPRSTKRRKESLIRPRELGRPFIRRKPARSVGMLPATGGSLPSLEGLASYSFDVRSKWHNCTENQIYQPLRIARPTRAEHLVDIIAGARHDGLKVKAIGSGHTFSDVSATTDILVETHGLNAALCISHEDLIAHDAILPGALPNSESKHYFVHVEAGMPLHTLNDLLFTNGMALINMGAYDAQTIVGAISTSTHGSGIGLGPLPDAVRSIEIITENGELWRIEPKENGITDPATFDSVYTGRGFTSKLVQDTELFRSVIVSMGTMGIVYSIILEVRDRYWLTETRVSCTWETIKQQLSSRPFDKHRHYELLVNPYSTVNGKHTAIITIRDEITGHPPTKPEGARNFLNALVGIIPSVYTFFDLLFEVFKEDTPQLIDDSMDQLIETKYVDLSYKVLNLGGANNISAYSTEIGFPLDTYIDAVDEILRIADNERSLGRVYHSAPFALRFVKSSEHYLSMMHGRETCMIEMPIVRGTFGWKEILTRYENAMYKHCGRPHWGQLQHVTGARGMIGYLYSEYPKWQRAYNLLNRFGLFENSFTNRCGFSGHEYCKKTPMQ